MTLHSFIDSYGYLAIFIGTFLEGETILVLGGIAAYTGHLQLRWVIGAAFLGSLTGDQLFFYLGRKHYHLVLSRLPSWKTRIDKVHALLERYRTLLILSFRFLYGLRTVSPFMIGMSTVPTARFVILNIVGAFVWALAVGSGGYFFGSAIESVIGHFKRYEATFFALAAIAALTIWIVRVMLRRRRAHRK